MEPFELGSEREDVLLSARRGHELDARAGARSRQSRTGSTPAGSAARFQGVVNTQYATPSMVRTQPLLDQIPMGTGPGGTGHSV